MTPETKSHVLTLAEIVGLCIVVFIVGALAGRYLPGMFGGSSQGGPSDSSQAETFSAGEEVSPDTYVPEAGDVPSGDVAVPSATAQAAPGVEAKIRTYSVDVNGNEFSPSTVVVYQGDTTTIRFTARDKDYDFTQPELGMSAEFPRGVEKLIQVTPSQPGKYTFFCSRCGGPDSGPVGQLVVVPKQ